MLFPWNNKRMNTNKLTNIEKDVLREIGNIGAGNATTSMADLVQEKMEMEVPAVHIISINELIDAIGGPEEEIVAIVCQIQGDISGTIYFVLTVEEAQSIVKQIPILKGMELFKHGQLQEIAVSVLMETANIITGSYLTALADLTSLHLQPTAPFFSMDMAGAALVTSLVEISHISDYALTIETTFLSASTSKHAKGHFMLMPDLDSIPVLLAALGIDNEES